MPRTLDQGFRDFVTKLTPTSSETAAAKSHRESIKSVLEKNFKMTNFFRTGSFGNGTSISGCSDVDYFAVFPSPELSVSSTISLVNVREKLVTRFPNTGVKVSCPTVLIPFGKKKSEWTEVAPCDHVSTDSRNFKVYEIADGSGGWLKSSPDSHNSYVKTINDKHNGKVKELIRFIKAWKYYNDVPISSFYLELQIARYCNSETAIVHRVDIKNVFKLLLSKELSSMQDPMGVSGLIAACSSNVQKDNALSKLKTAYNSAVKAMNAEGEGDTKAAFDFYNLIYKNNFPNYYL